MKSSHVQFLMKKIGQILSSTTTCFGLSNINALCHILANQYLVPDQARQHARPVCAWIHLVHELDKLTPSEYQ